MKVVILVVTAILCVIGACHADEGAKKSADFPANPLNKEGWTLVVKDEFDGPELNEKLWIPEYCPGRFKTARKAFYYFKDGAIHLHVNDNTAEDFFGYQAVSSLQTFNCHKLVWKDYESKPDDTPQTNKFTQLYGWYEIRAKHVGPMHHIAFWALEAKVGGSEIDVTEDPAWPGPNWHKWISPTPFPTKRKSVSSYDKITSKEQRAAGFHIYALEVFPGGTRIYHDNILIEEADVDWKKRGETPLMFFLGIYGSKNKQDFNQKQEYVIDYFRAYKKQGETVSQPDAGDGK